MDYPSLDHLGAKSTLAELPSHDFQVTADTWGNRVAAEFDRNAGLPGVMIVRDRTLLGVISREKFLEHLSKPFALEVYMKRPIEVMLTQIDMQPLELDAALGIDEAATIVLSRQRKMVYEPIVVRRADGDVRLLGTEVLLLTAHAMKGDREHCLDAGMDGYVSKPIHAGKLFQTIDAVMQSSSAGEDPPAADILSARVTRPSHSIEWSEALAHTDGDADMMRAVIGVFLDESPKMLDEARAALAAQDGPRLRRAGHSLKGACGYFGEGPAYEAAFLIEQLGQAGEFGPAADVVDELLHYLDQLKPALVEFRSRA